MAFMQGGTPPGHKCICKTSVPCDPDPATSKGPRRRWGQPYDQRITTDLSKPLVHHRSDCTTAGNAEGGACGCSERIVPPATGQCIQARPFSSPQPPASDARRQALLQPLIHVPMYAALLAGIRAALTLTCRARRPGPAAAPSTVRQSPACAFRPPRPSRQWPSESGASTPPANLR